MLAALALTTTATLSGPLAGSASATPNHASVATFRSQFSAGTGTAVTSHGTRWISSASAVKGGRSERVAGYGESLLSHAQVGNASWRLRVAGPGTYRLSVVLRTVAHRPAIINVMIGGRTVRRVTGVRPTTLAASIAAATVSIVVTTTSSTLVVGVAGVTGAPAVSGLAVTGLRGNTSAGSAATTAGAATPGPAAAATNLAAAATNPATTNPATTSAATSTGLPLPGPGQGWASGAYPGLTIDQAAADQFAAYRGRALDVVDVFQSRDNWDKIANSTWSTDVYKGFPGRLVIGLPLLPDNLTASSMPALAAGAFDSYFKSFAANLAANGRGNSIIRLGWEFNGNWFSWAATNPAVYIAAFRRVVGDLRSAAPGLLIDWNGNLGYSQVGHDPFTELYPGDDVVDIVGVDIYDNKYNHVTDEASWQQVKAGDHGLDAWDAFAVAHGKKFSVPEWGLDDQGPGDNPYFIQKMHDWFAANASSLAFECYFNEPSAYIGNSLDTNQNPLSAALYRLLWQG